MEVIRVLHLFTTLQSLMHYTVLHRKKTYGRTGCIGALVYSCIFYTIIIAYNENTFIPYTCTYSVSQILLIS